MRIELPNHGQEEGVCRLHLVRPHVRQPSDRSSDFADGAAEVDLARLHERLEGGLELLSVARRSGSGSPLNACAIAWAVSDRVWSVGRKRRRSVMTSRRS